MNFEGTEILSLAAEMAQRAKPHEQIDVMISHSTSTSVKAFRSEVESFTSAESFAFGIRVIADHRQGFASAGTLERAALLETLEEARDNRKFGEQDEFLGLAEPDGIEAVRIDHWNPSILDIDSEQKIAIALDLERRTVESDPRITGVRTAGWSDHAGEVAYATSTGVLLHERGTSCSVGVQALSAEDGETQTGAAGDAARSLAALDIDRVIREASDRATRMLGATQPKSARLPIVLEPRLALTLIGILSGMIDGEAVNKGRSPFGDRLNEPIASPLLTCVDDPTDLRSIAASSFDGEGLACRRNLLIESGHLRTFLQNSYTARRAGSRSTGSAVRGARSLPGVSAQVLVIEPGQTPAAKLLKGMGNALFVNSLTGLHSGVNPVSGDFSVGADGILIRDGVLAEPVRELTLASTVQRLLLDIIAVGDDQEWTSSGDAGCTLVIGDVSLSGSD